MGIFQCHVSFHGCRKAKKVLLIPGPRRENLDGAVGPRADERPRVVKWLVFVDFFFPVAIVFFCITGGGGKPQAGNSV